MKIRPNDRMLYVLHNVRDWLSLVLWTDERYMTLTPKQFDRTAKAMARAEFLCDLTERYACVELRGYLAMAWFLLKVWHITRLPEEDWPVAPKQTYIYG